MSRLNMDFTEEEDKKIENIKKYTGITQNTEVMRFAIAFCWRHVKTGEILDR
jgi:hypothetical protein